VTDLREILSIDPSLIQQYARGELWTAREAEAELDLCEGQVDVWRNRGYVEPGLINGRSRYYWSDDLYDQVFASRRQRATRDESGRFLPRISPV
jgi:hypothetical protein